jgi:subtilase family serine protease
VGDFTVPGTIDLVSNATPSGCSRGQVAFSGRATYRGLNLAGTPPVEGADVTITITNYQGGPRTIKTTTDIFGNWYYYDDPCRNDPDDGCVGYICGVTYNYTVEVTDFTLTSPSVPGSVTRPCVPCNSVPKLSQAVGVSGCILQGAAFTAFGSITNFISTVTGGKICAPTVYRDTITLYINGQLVSTFTEDSIISCARKTYTYNSPGMDTGTHEFSMNHVYYFADNERTEQTSSESFKILPLLADLEPRNGVTKTGHTSFTWGESNTVCGVTAGRHTMYLYDSLPGYAEKILIDSALVESLAPQSGIGFSYSNPLLAPGCHYLTIVSDSKAQVAELIETNNINETQFCVIKPDLAFNPRPGRNLNIQVSSSTGTPGSLINFATKISNYGGPVNQPFSVQFRANGILLGGKINIPSLAPGEVTTLASASFTVPTSQCPVQITAMVDSDNLIDEEQEKNNFDTLQYGINIKAGRKCDDMDNIGSGFFGGSNEGGCVPYISTRGVLSHYSTDVRNTGSRDARNVKVQFRWNGIQLGTDVIPLIKAGQKVESGFFYAFDTVGRFIINAFADYTREICEINELDNIGNIHIDVKPSVADLEILSQYIAPSNLNPDPGQTITIVSSILNKGDAPSTPAKIRFWVNDLQLGDDIQIDSLFPGMDTTVMATVTYSSTIVGPKIIKVTADIENEVVERTKNNNEATRAVIICGAPDFARAKSEAITLRPTSFNVGDTIIIRHYIRNYGGDGGAAWVRFYYRNIAGEKILIDSIRIGLEINDSTRIGLRWKVPEAFGQIITEIGNSIPPEFNELNNIDSLPFGTALPLTLLSFDGVVKNEQAVLTWRTTSEENVKQFELERSFNGTRFEKVSIINAQNTTGILRYQYTDVDFNTVPSNNIFYRLRMVDIDMQFSYSNIVRLTKPLLADYVKVYPNPVKHTLLVQVRSSVNGHYNLSIIDAGGKLILAKQFGVSAGMQTLSMPVQILPQGIYVLIMRDADGSSKEVRFIKD